MIAASIDYKNQAIVSGPDIMSRGFIYMRESGDLIAEIQSQTRAIINRTLNQNGKNINERAVRDALFDELQPIIYKKTQRSPMLMPVLLDINKGVRKRQNKKS